MSDVFDLHAVAIGTLEYHAAQCHDLGGWDSACPDPLAYALIALAYVLEVT